MAPNTTLALPSEELHASAGPLDWKALVMAGLLAVGFSSTFLGPVINIQSDQRAGGQILGDSDSKPLIVPVTVTTIDREPITVSTTPTTGTLSDALSRAATTIGGGFSYTSRGKSMYLQEFAGVKNSDEGMWEIRHNDVVVTDLQSVTLLQGDRVTMTYRAQ